jgi:biopolymer transport protein ExbD
MSMQVGTGGGSRDPEVMVDINTTPLIDVMLVLLIMLIITLPMQFHAVNINMPIGTPPPPATPPVVINITVDFDGTIDWNGTTVPDHATLEARMAGVAAEANQPEIHLKPHKLATYKYVAEVMSSAQRLGVTKIGLVGNEQFIK